MLFNQHDKYILPPPPTENTPDRSHKDWHAPLTRNDGVQERGSPGQHPWVISPAIDAIMLTFNTSTGVIGGNIISNPAASIDFLDPGGPVTHQIMVYLGNYILYKPTTR